MLSHWKCTSIQNNRQKKLAVPILWFTNNICAFFETDQILASMHTGFRKPIPILKLNEQQPADEIQINVEISFWLCKFFSHPVLRFIFLMSNAIAAAVIIAAAFMNRLIFILPSSQNFFSSVQFVGLSFTSVSAHSMHRNKHEVSHKHGSNFKVHWKILDQCTECVCNVQVWVYATHLFSPTYFLVDSFDRNIKHVILYRKTEKKH